MSSVTRKPHRLERHRAKLKAKTTPELQGKGKADVRAAKVVSIQAALAQKKKSSKLVRDLDSLGVAELNKKLDEARKELFNMRFKHATAQLESVASIPATKRQIARILTLIKQKEVGA